MLSSAHYLDWNSKRIRAIIDYYNPNFWVRKRILDLGAGHGDIANAFARLGADVLCVDARQENLQVINNKYPHIRTMLVDLDNEFPFDNNFDVVMSLGLLCHLRNPQNHIKQICSIAEHVILETEVLDHTDSNSVINIDEERTVDDLSFSGNAQIITANAIQNAIYNLGAKFKRADDRQINSGHNSYDWKESGVNERTYGKRRLWFIRQNKFVLQQAHNTKAFRELQSQVEKTRPVHNVITSTLRHRESDQNPYRPIPNGRPVNHQVNVNYNYAHVGPIGTAKQSGPQTVIRLFVNYYEDSNQIRQHELNTALQKNLENQQLDIIVIDSEERPTFNFFFEKINIISGPNDINIIANADIFFDESINQVHRLGNKEVYALSRWEFRNVLSKAIFSESPTSQDAWIIRGRVKGVNGDFKLGLPGSDGRIAYEFHKAGYTVLNPSKTIRAYHFHQSSIRNYSDSDRVADPYMAVPPISL